LIGKGGNPCQDVTEFVLLLRLGSFAHGLSQFADFFG
jgi:hypothetical protein